MQHKYKLRKIKSTVNADKPTIVSTDDTQCFVYPVAKNVFFIVYDEIHFAFQLDKSIVTINSATFEHTLADYLGVDYDLAAIADLIPNTTAIDVKNETNSIAISSVENGSIIFGSITSNGTCVINDNTYNFVLLDLNKYTFQNQIKLVSINKRFIPLIGFGNYNHSANYNLFQYLPNTNIVDISELEQEPSNVDLSDYGDINTITFFYLEQTN